MEVEMGEPSTYSGKKFEFLDIEWMIENFCFASFRKDWVCQTPEFTINGFHTTRWVMILTCETIGRKDFLKLGLKRSDSDPGPEVIWVDLRIEMQCPYEEYESVNMLCCFRKGFISSVDLEIMASLLKELKPYGSDLIELRCKMIIYGEELSEAFQPCSNVGIRSLSEDLLKLFSRNVYWDLELKFGTNSIKVHKIVACFRLKDLNFLILQRGQKSTDGEWDVLDMSNLNYDAMVKIMKYVYSGDLQHVLGEPSLFIYDCLYTFDIPEVKSYYVPHEFHFSSVVNKSELNFEWILREKRNLLSRQPIESPEFADSSTGTKWQLHLIPNADVESDHYDLLVLCMADIEIVATIDCGAAVNNNRYLFIEMKRLTPDSRMFCSEKFLGLNIVESLENGNYLNVTVRIRLSNGLTSTNIETQNVSFVDYTPERECYYLLSAHMESACNDGLFSDLHLYIDSITYKMHKSIIAARSSTILELVNQMSVGGANPFSGIEPSTFCMLMRFLYTGVMLENCLDGDFIDLYRRAVDFNLPVLKELCSLTLRHQMQNNPVIRAEVFEISVQYNDEVLKEAVRQRISARW